MKEKMLITTSIIWSSYDEYQKNPDDTHRLFYVACTRTENNLHIIDTTKEKSI